MFVAGAVVFLKDVLKSAIDGSPNNFSDIVL